MDIGQYISDLLNEHNEVSLPGFGTFFKRSRSAYYNEAEGIFYPPADIIDFKSEEEGSPLLVNFIVDSKHISEASALYFIERFCENLKSTLNRDLSATISPLGSLHKTNDGYSLEPMSTQGAAFFGLKPIKDSHTAVINHRKNNDIQAPEQQLEYAEEKSGSSSKGIWIVLSIIVLLFALGGLAFFYYPELFKNLNLQTNNKPRPKTVSPVIKPSTIKDSVSFADSLVKELEKQGMHGAQVEKAQDTLRSNITTSLDSTKKASQPDKVYEVIVASFGLKREAEASVRNLRHRGIDAKIVVDSKKPKYKVSLGTFTTMVAANKEKKRIQQELIKDAWILTVINKEN